MSYRALVALALVGCSSPAPRTPARPADPRVVDAVTAAGAKLHTAECDLWDRIDPRRRGAEKHL